MTFCPNDVYRTGKVHPVSCQDIAVVRIDYYTGSSTEPDLGPPACAKCAEQLIAPMQVEIWEGDERPSCQDTVPTVTRRGLAVPLADHPATAADAELKNALAARPDWWQPSAAPWMGLDWMLDAAFDLPQTANRRVFDFAFVHRATVDWDRATLRWEAGATVAAGLIDRDVKVGTFATPGEAMDAAERALRDALAAA